MKPGNYWILTVIFSTLPLFGVGLGTVTPIFGAEPSEAPLDRTGEKLQEIQVTLFGQPCIMSGPFTRPTLSLLHEISPEKIPPTATVDLMKKVRAKTTLLKSIPFSLEQYRDHLRKRLSAKIAMEEALAGAKKSKPQEGRRALDSLLKNLKEHISSLQYPAFEAATKKSFEANAAVWNDFFIEPLRERYDSAIQPETEEEFHKAIRTAKIQYICVFDDAADHSSEETEH